MARALELIRDTRSGRDRSGGGRASPDDRGDAGRQSSECGRSGTPRVIDSTRSAPLCQHHPAFSSSFQFQPTRAACGRLSRRRYVARCAAGPVAIRRGRTHPQPTPVPLHPRCEASAWPDEDEISHRLGGSRPRSSRSGRTRVLAQIPTTVRDNSTSSDLANRA